MATNKILEQLAQADKVEPLAEWNGIKIVSFEDGVILTAADTLIDEPDTTVMQINANGLPAETKTKYAAVNADRMFANRIRYVDGEDGAKKLQVVIDYRAIQEQESGRIYVKRVTAYELARKDKNLVVDKVLTVDDNEFIGQFTDTLDIDSMLEVLTAIENEGQDKTAVKLGI